MISTRTKFILFAVFVLVTFSVRLLPHAPNLVPMGALAIVGGMYLKNWWAPAILYSVLVLSDLFLGLYSLGVMASVYIGFGVFVLLGRAIRQNRSWEYVVVGSFVGSLFFYFLTNTAVWAFSPLYEKTLFGLSNSLIAAIPFFRNSLAANLGYGLAFFFAARFVYSYSFRSSILQKFSKCNRIFVTHT